MNNNIILNASMRSNLLSLRNISKQMDKTQLILATGKEVNSAIDNASAYYQARSLTNRAADLTALLDAMEQGIQTIEAATQGLTSGAEFLEQASAVVNEAASNISGVPEKEWFVAQDGVAAVVSNWQELKAAVKSNLTGDIVIYGNIECEEAFTLKDGQNLVGVGKFGISQPDKDKYSQLSFDIASMSNVTTCAIKCNGNNQFSDITLKMTSSTSKNTWVIEAAKSSAEILSHNIDVMVESNGGIRCFSGGTLTFTGVNSLHERPDNERLNIVMIGIASKVNIYGELNIDARHKEGYGLYACSNINVYDGGKLSISAKNHGLNFGTYNFYGDAKLNIETQNNGAYYGATLNFYDQASAEITAQTAFTGVTINIASAQAMLNISTIGNFNCKMQAVENAKIIVNGNVYKFNSDTNQDVTGMVPPNSTVIATRVAQPEGLGDMLMANSSRVMEYQDDDKASYIDKKYSEQYKKILEEYDNLLSDSSYQGINLLKGGNLEVTFNESRSNQYTVAGVLADSMSLGLETRDLFDTSAIKKSLEEITKAVNSIRSFQEELGNHYSIIKTRINFTEALTDVLETGADNLTLADMNEASAQYLTLQTRQQLAINSLSLASQSAQSVLSLF